MLGEWMGKGSVWSCWILSECSEGSGCDCDGSWHVSDTPQEHASGSELSASPRFPVCRFVTN